VLFSHLIIVILQNNDPRQEGVWQRLDINISKPEVKRKTLIREFARAKEKLFFACRTYVTWLKTVIVGSL